MVQIQKKPTQRLLKMPSDKTYAGMERNLRLPLMPRIYYALHEQF